MIYLSWRMKGGEKYRIQAEKGEDLLFALDKFLKKNKISKANVSDWKIDTKQEDSITSRRISQSILHALKF